MKRAQISMFIIIGLIILLAAIIGYVAFEDSLTYKPPEEQVTSELETQLKPFVFVIQECQERLLDEAAKKLLKKGGYYDNPALLSTISPQGNAIELAEDNKIPYWHYLDDGQQATQRPVLQSDVSASMSEQLAGYVDERLESCVPWENFPEYEIQTAEIDSSVTFTQQETTIVTEWPTSVQTPAGTKNYQSFTASIDAPVKHLYEVADEQVRLMADGHIPEETLLSLLSIYASGDTALPPLAGSLGFSDGYRLWPLDAAREELAEVISRSTDFLQVYGSQDAQLLLSDIELINNIQYDSLLASDHDISDTRIQFYPTRKDVYYAVDDNTAVAIPTYLPRPDILSALIPPVVDTDFSHDITYPMLISVEKNGYELLVGYEANIRNTQPQEGAENLNEQSENPCMAAGGSQVNVTVRRADEQQLEEPVSVVYSCGPLLCPVAETTSTAQAQLPSCAAGTLEAFEGNLFSEPVSFSSAAGNAEEIDITLYEPKEVRINVQGLDVRKVGDAYTLSSTPRSVDADVIFVRQSGQYVAQARAGETAELIPGTYDIIVIEVAQFDPVFATPEQEICAGSFLTGDECVTINRTEFESLPIVYLDAEDIEVSAVPDELTVTASSIAVRSIDGQIVPANIETIQDLEYVSKMVELQPEQILS